MAFPDRLMLRSDAPHRVSKHARHDPHASFDCGASRRAQDEEQCFLHRSRRGDARSCSVKP